MANPPVFEKFEDSADVDLNVGGAEELAKLAAMVDEVETEVEAVTAEQQESLEPEFPVETQVEEQPAQAATLAVDPRLQQLVEERAALQDRLDEVSVHSALDRQRLERLEAAIQREREQEVPTKQEPEGPTPEQILSHLDTRINQLDAGLTRTEAEDPTKAAPLRAQLRQLERYYNDYTTQLRMEAARGPDPQELISTAVRETEHRNQFQQVRSTVTNEYPMLDTNSDYFNAQLRDQVHRYYNPMIKEGQDPSQALIEAATLVMRANGVMSVSEYNRYLAHQEAAQAQASAALPQPTAGERKTEAVQRNVDAAAATPPNMAGLGQPNTGSKSPVDKYDWNTMSIEEVMRISDDELERIEGALALYNE
jgi:hypothetical protein